MSIYTHCANMFRKNNMTPRDTFPVIYNEMMVFISRQIIIA